MSNRSTPTLSFRQGLPESSAMDGKSSGGLNGYVDDGEPIATDLR